VATKLSVAVGIMDYRGWRANDPQSEAIRHDYLSKISSFICWLLERGFSAKLVMGDATDRHALDGIMQRLTTSLSEEDLSRVESGSAASLHDIMNEMSKADVAVVSRYHNLVCSLKLARPTISLGYARKNDDLMEDFHQGRYCLHIETFTVDGLKAMFDELLDNRSLIELQIRQAKERWQDQLLEQQLLLQESLLPAHASDMRVPRRRLGVPIRNRSNNASQ
jgi:polysaccharide pyruvyl transferase WcaK-like protein